MDQMNPLPQMSSADVDMSIPEPMNTLPAKVTIIDDHELDMAKAQCYKAAKNAMEIHKLLKMVDNLESWMQAKITLAAEYLEAVASNLEYDVVASTMMESAPVTEAKTGKYEEDPKYKEDAALGRKIMDYSEKAKFKPEPGMSKKEKAAAEDEFFKLMNDFSRVGEKMTLLGTINSKGNKILLNKSDRDIVDHAKKLMSESADLKKKK